jgi:hypothetical protein
MADEMAIKLSLPIMYRIPALIASLLLAASASAAPYEICAISDPECDRVVDAFLKSQAAVTQKRLHRIFVDTMSKLSGRDRQVLDREQEDWDRSVRITCKERAKLAGADAATEKRECLANEQFRRAVALDLRLASILDKRGSVYWRGPVPIRLSETNLDIYYGSEEYATRTGHFDLSRMANGTYHLDFSTPGSNGHLCDGAATMRRRGNLLELIAADGEDPPVDLQTGNEQVKVQVQTDENGTCNLTAKVFPYHVELDGNFACKMLFSCGERAATVGIFFR